MLQRPADLPQTVVRLVPVLGELIDERGLDRPALLVLVPTLRARVLKGDHDLAEDVRLLLVDGAVADAHRPRIRVPGQMVEFTLGQLAPTVDRVHDLHVLGITGEGTHEPLAPLDRRVDVAGAQQRLET